MPRQEPGRYFALTFVPSVDEPQRQPNRPAPELTAQVAVVVALPASGDSVTMLPLTAVEMP